MSYTAIVTKLTNVRPHPNADRVLLATCNGNQVVVGLDCVEGTHGIYFASDGQLSHEFCRANNLYREKTMNKLPEEKGGMFDANRRVRAQRFRGEISDGFWVPLSHLSFITSNYCFTEGFEFDSVEGIPICSKYVNPATEKVARENATKKAKNAKTSVMFKEHFDTAHFGKYLNVFDKGQLIHITEKLHGTSGRIGYVQVDRDLNWIEKLAKRFGVSVEEREWRYMNGTRRVVLEESSGTQFHDPSIRDRALALFKGNLRKGETVYFEIVGFESTGAAIMPPADTKGLNDKEFTKRFGEKMYYSYGCEPASSDTTKQSDVYVYRITLTNEDGQTIDYTWPDVVKRCNEMGVKFVPHIETVKLDEIELYLNGGSREEMPIDALRSALEVIVNEYGKGPSLVDNRHIREGVCVRIDGGLQNQTFKFKSFEFKVLEGIVKDSGVVDAEEAQG
jgi:hypothetical protein